MIFSLVNSPTSKSTRLVLLLVLTCHVLASTVAKAQAHVNDYIMHPKYDPAVTWMGLLGASVTFVPRPIAEEEIRQIPFVDARLRVNVWNGVSLGFHAASNYLTYTGSVSGQWSTRVGPFDLAIGDEELIWYGRATMDEFDVDAIGYVNVPHFSVGLSSSEFLLSLRAEMLFLTYRTTRVGDVEIASDKNQRLGASVAVYVEQPYANKTHLLLGLKLNSLKNAYQSWLAFSTFNDPLLYPELSIGLIL